MYLKSTQFDHDGETLDQAINLSKQQLYRCRERIFFSTISNALQGLELYGDEDAPKEFRTKTGDLARTLSLITDPLEYEYTLLIFVRFQDLTQEIVAKYVALNDSNMSQSSKSKLQLMIDMANLVMEHSIKESEDDDSNSTNTDAITPASVFRRIDLVKKSFYTWDTYYNMIKAKNFYYPKGEFKAGSDFDIDGLLNNLFNNDDK